MILKKVSNLFYSSLKNPLQITEFFSTKDDLIWESDDGWSFEKIAQTSVWIQKYDQTIFAKYFEISIDSDEKYYPIVILRKNSSDSDVLKLTQGASYIGLDYYDLRNFSTGYWKNKEGSITFFLKDLRTFIFYSLSIFLIL